MLNGPAILAFHREQRRARRQAIAVGPVAARLLERAALTRVLDGQEQRAAIGSEFAAAHFTSDGAARELLGKPARGSAGRYHEAAVVRTAALVGVGDYPQPALWIEAEIVG